MDVSQDFTDSPRNYFFRFSPIDLLIILFQLTKFEAPSSDSFRDIMITNFQSPNLQREIIRKLDFMFMKHYAPNRCLYIKVAKLITGVGSAETSYLQNCSVKLFKEHFKVQICKGRLFEKIK